MLKRVLISALFVLMISVCYGAIPTSSQEQFSSFFNIQGTGNLGGAANINLCLMGLGPLSCQTFTVTNSTLDITTTIRNKTYTSAGIKVNTSGYEVLYTDCQFISTNGYCIFTVSDKITKIINITNANTPPALSLTSMPSTAAQVNIAYSQTNVASNGTTPYVYSVSAGALPAGTTLNTTTGTVSGTPTTAGAFNYTIQVTDNVGGIATAPTTGTIAAAVTLTATPSVAKQVNVGYSQTNVASNGTAPYVYSVSAGTLPAGTTLNTTTGTVSGTPTTAGAFNYTIQVTDNVGGIATAPTTGTIVAALTLTATPSAATQVNFGYSQTNVASNGTAPYVYSVSAGTLPAGTTLNTTTGTVSGTPTTAGAFNYTIQVTDNVGGIATAPTTGTINSFTWVIDSLLVGNSYISCTDQNCALLGGNTGVRYFILGEFWTAYAENPITTNGTSFRAVSCATNSFCEAFSGSAAAFAWEYLINSWTSTVNQINTAPLVSVSCPTTTFCLAVGQTGGASNAYTYNGTTWSTATVTGGTTSSLIGVSCASATSCAVVDSTGNAYVLSGGAWTKYTSVSANAFTGISCPSSTFCVAVDNSGNSYKFNGATWASAGASIDPNVLNAVSCPTTTFCMAVDNAGNFLIYNGSLWSAPTNFDGANSVLSVSCLSSSFCGASDNVGNGMIYRVTPGFRALTNQNSAEPPPPSSLISKVQESSHTSPERNKSVFPRHKVRYIDSNNQLWLADSEAIRRLPANGTSTEYSVTITGLTNPSAIVTDLDNNLYVLTQESGLYVFPPVYQEPGFYTVSSPGYTKHIPPADMGLPHTLTLDASNNIWLTNKNMTGPYANSIMEFSANGLSPANKTLYCSNSCLNGPGGIWIDKESNVWVTNLNNPNTITVFANPSSPGTLNATPLCIINITGSEVPNQIAIDSEGYIYVNNDTTDGYFSAINVYKPILMSACEAQGHVATATFVKEIIDSTTFTKLWSHLDENILTHK